MSQIVVKPSPTGNGYLLSFPYNQTVKDLLKSTFRGAKFDFEAKNWSIPLAEQIILDSFCEVAERILVKDEAEHQAERAAIEAWRQARKDAEAAERVEAEAREEADRLERDAHNVARGYGYMLIGDPTINVDDIIEIDGRRVLVLVAFTRAYMSGPEAQRLGCPHLARTSPRVVEYETLTPENEATRNARIERRRFASRRKTILDLLSDSDDRPENVELIRGATVDQKRGRSSEITIIISDDGWLWQIVRSSWTADDGPLEVRPLGNYGYANARRIPVTDEISEIFKPIVKA